MSSSNRQKIIGKVTDGGREFPVVAIEIINNPALPFVLVGAGIHGNEIASVTALEEFVSEEIDAYTKRFNFIIFPCMNPVGRARNTRENGNGVDLNRNFLSEKPEEEVRAIKKYLDALRKKFLVAVDMHEDVTDEIVPGYDPKDNPRSMYIYEVSDKNERFGEKVILGLRTAGIRIAGSKTIYGKTVNDGIIWSPWARESLLAGSFTDSYLCDFTVHAFVIETPTCWPMDERVAAHKKALALVLDMI